LGLRHVGDQFVRLEEEVVARIRSYEAVGAREELPSDAEFLDALIHHPIHGSVDLSRSEVNKLFVLGEQWWDYHGPFAPGKVRPDWYEWVSRARFCEEAERLLRRRSLGGRNLRSFGAVWRR
ncbi:MAG: hypothetical protein Q9M35_01155, partial [Rhodothermus sp.]|nr:hypothetical protein [Rhodothermus sp.]